MLPLSGASHRATSASACHLMLIDLHSRTSQICLLNELQRGLLKVNLVCTEGLLSERTECSVVCVLERQSRLLHTNKLPFTLSNNTFKCHNHNTNCLILLKVTVVVSSSLLSFNSTKNVMLILNHFAQTKTCSEHLANEANWVNEARL